MVRLLGLEVPGPVMGMLVLLVVLRIVRPGPSSALVRGPAVLLGHLQLLFVPAGVGIIVYLHTLRHDALPLAAGLWLSWLLGLGVTAVVVVGLDRITRRRSR